MGLIATWTGNAVNLNGYVLRTHSRAVSMPIRAHYGIVHAGGPAPASNAAIAGVVSAAYNRHVGVVGFIDGFKGAMEGRAIELEPCLTSEIGSLGGVAIGTSRFNPNEEQRAQLIDNFKKWGISGLIAIGGDDTNTTASRLSQMGFPVIGIPKTIDNDIPGTAETHGFQTVVQKTAEALKALKRDAQCQDNPCIFLAEIMGRKSGAWTFETGRAAEVTASYIPEEFSIKGLVQILDSDFSGKDFILARTARMLRVNGEILDTVSFIRAIEHSGNSPVDLRLDATLLAKEIVNVIAKRNKPNIPYGVFAIAEGIADRLPTEVVSRDSEGRPESFRVLGLGKEVEIKVDAHHNPRLSDVKISDHLIRLVNSEAKNAGIKIKAVSQTFGYQYRCVDPTAYDKNLGLAEGFAAMEALDSGRSGLMVSSKGNANLTYVDYRDLPYDETGHLVPRPYNLSGLAYEQGVSSQQRKSYENAV